jgi:hypothetical protein
MRHQEDAVLTSLCRAQQFFDDHSAALTAVNPNARKELDDIVLQLTELAVAQDSGARGGWGETARNHALRDKLREHHMTPVVQMVKYKLESVPELATLRVPSSRVGAEDLVASALSMAEVVEPHRQLFIDSGLAPTFVDDLRGAANAVSDSIVERGSFRGRRNGATAGLAENEKRGRALLKLLTSLVLPQLGDDAQLVGEWKSAAKVRRRAVRGERSKPATLSEEGEAPGADAGVDPDHPM